MAEYFWKSRKRNWLGLPWSTVKYTLYEDRLIVKTGFFKVNEDEIRLYRISDITLKRSFWQRLTGMGTIHLCGSDTTLPELDLVNVKKAKVIRNLISDLVDRDRKKRNVMVRDAVGMEHGTDNRPDMPHMPLHDHHHD